MINSKILFGPVVLISILLGFALPSVGLLLKPYLVLLLFFLMIFSCYNIHFHQVVKSVKHPSRLFMVLLIIHIFAPFLIFLLKPFLDSSTFVGLIIATAVPSGVSVVFLCSICRGDPAEALTITSISNLLSPLLVPFVVWMFVGELISISALPVMILILKVVVLPLVINALLQHSGFLDRAIKKVSKPLSMILLGLIVFGIVSPFRDFVFDDPLHILFVSLIVAVVIVITFFAGYILGRTKKEKITLGIGGSFKNFTLATVIALTLFDAYTAVPAIVYTFLNTLIMIPIHWFFTRKGM